MSGDRLTLQWSDFQKNVGRSFLTARKDEDFFDVTLVCEDHEVEAHRLVLSSGSNFFQDILRRTKHPYPLLYLKGVWKAELVGILEFLYYGQTSVPQSQLEKFIETAKDLKVKGVLDEEEEQRGNSPNPQATLEPHVEVKEIGQQLEYEQVKTEGGLEFKGDVLISKISLEPKIAVHNYNRQLSNIDEEATENTKKKKEKKSLMWKYFTPVTPQHAECPVCKKLIGTNNGSTSSMKKHLASHKQEYGEYKKRQAEIDMALQQAEEEERKGNSPNPQATLEPHGEVKDIGQQLEYEQVKTEGGLEFKGDVLISKISLEPKIAAPNYNKENNINEEATENTKKRKEKKSLMWKYFTPVTPQHAECPVCKKLIGTNNSSTSSMKKHLASHKQEYGEYKKRQAEIDQGLQQASRPVGFPQEPE